MKEVLVVMAGTSALFQVVFIKCRSTYYDIFYTGVLPMHATIPIHAKIL